MTPVADESVLVLNCGSSSVKFGLYSAGVLDHGAQPRMHGQVSGLPGAAQLSWSQDGAPARREPLPGVRDHEQAIACLLDRIEAADRHARVRAVGHRVVHGGPDFHGPVLVDGGVLKTLEALVPLAPLHQPHNLAGIRASAQRVPGALQVACFDTAFHAGQSALHTSFALPASLRDRGVRRYGFHGLSYQSIAERLCSEAGDLGSGRVIVAHLGSGASVCGLLDRRSVRSSMGMTALDGLVMGTRPGATDIGVALYAIQTLGIDVSALEHLLYHDSGLLGLSGLSNDVRSLLASADPRAAFALAVFCERAAQEIAATMVALQGCDLLVFTAGIGENSPAVRAAIAARLAFVGAVMDESANARNDARLSAPDSAIEIRMMRTDEESVIARAAWSTAQRADARPGGAA